MVGCGRDFMSQRNIIIAVIVIIIIVAAWFFFGGGEQEVEDATEGTTTEGTAN